MTCMVGRGLSWVQLWVMGGGPSLWAPGWWVAAPQGRAEPAETGSKADVHIVTEGGPSRTK